MQEKTNKAQLDHESDLQVRNLFYKRIASVEQNQNRLTMADQMKVRELQNALMNFIEINRLSLFHIMLLGPDADIDQPKRGIIVKNFEKYNDIQPRVYLIGIHESWKDMDVYQLSTSGRKIPVDV